MSIYRKFAWGYAAMFVVIAALNYIPGLTDGQGNLFGLFSLQWWDDVLHLASGLWAAWAAWKSEAASIFYFKLFGLIYFFDGVMGFFLGQAYLDAGIFINGPAPFDWMTKFLANLPHLLIGGIAVLIGFWLTRRAWTISHA